MYWPNSVTLSVWPGFCCSPPPQYWGERPHPPDSLPDLPTPVPLTAHLHAGGEIIKSIIAQKYISTRAGLFEIVMVLLIKLKIMQSRPAILIWRIKNVVVCTLPVHVWHVKQVGRYLCSFSCSESSGTQLKSLYPSLPWMLSHDKKFQALHTYKTSMFTFQSMGALEWGWIKVVIAL